LHLFVTFTKISSPSLLMSDILFNLIKQAQEANTQTAINILSKIIQDGNILSTTTDNYIRPKINEGRANASGLISYLKKEKDFPITKQTIDSIIAIMVYSNVVKIAESSKRQQIIADINNIIEAIKAVGGTIDYNVNDGVNRLVDEIGKILPSYTAKNIPNS
jgi:hypothetical protein